MIFPLITPMSIFTYDKIVKEMMRVFGVEYLRALNEYGTKWLMAMNENKRRTRVFRAWIVCTQDGRITLPLGTRSTLVIVVIQLFWLSCGVHGIVDLAFLFFGLSGSLDNINVFEQRDVFISYLPGPLM